MKFVRGRSMPYSYEVLPGGDALGELRISPRTAGPTDRWCAEAIPCRRRRWQYLVSTHRPLACGRKDGHFWQYLVDEDATWVHGFRGIKLEVRSAPPAVGLQDYSSVRNQPPVVAVGLDRLASSEGVHWFEKDGTPLDLRMRPTRLIEKGEKVRVVRAWGAGQSAGEVW